MGLQGQEGLCAITAGQSFSTVEWVCAEWKRKCFSVQQDLLHWQNTCLPPLHTQVEPHKVSADSPSPQWDEGAETFSTSKLLPPLPRRRHSPPPPPNAWVLEGLNLSLVTSNCHKTGKSHDYAWYFSFLRWAGWLWIYCEHIGMGGSSLKIITLSKQRLKFKINK